MVGVGVAGSTAKSLAAACDRFDSYDSLPGVRVPEPTKKESAQAAQRQRKRSVDPAAELLERALRLENDKDPSQWQHASAVKSLITRLDSSFSEKSLGHRSFTEFVSAHPEIAEMDESDNIVRIRLVDAKR